LTLDEKIPLHLGTVAGILERPLTESARASIDAIAADFQRFLKKPVRSIATFAAGVDEIGEESDIGAGDGALRERIAALAKEARDEQLKQTLIGTVAGAIAGYFV
jgi:hypothetical protein